MAAPRAEIVHKKIKNPHASAPLIIPILVLSNTSDEQLLKNIETNSKLPLQWVAAWPPHDRPAILVGGGPSVHFDLENIHWLKQRGGVIYAMNAASQWLHENGIEADFQVICDAKEETATLVDTKAKAHLFASQVNPATMNAVENPILWHLGGEAIEEVFPPEKRKRGGYALIGGGAAVGNSSACLAYALGHRELHCFGFDSSHKDGNSHAYRQDMNKFIPTMEVEWAGRTFTSSVAMKAQAEKFQVMAQMLKKEGCTIEVYGDGLLQHMYRTPLRLLTERDKYRQLWQSESYREVAPGEFVVDEFLKFAKAPATVIDFGCGTGRASLRLKEKGFDPVLLDFADNCRDEEAMTLPFLEWDLSLPCPLRAPYGLCTDVMEHIPTDDVPLVIKNIMEAASKVLFQISTVPDKFGAMVGATLHNTVEPHQWWAATFEVLGFKIENQEQGPISSIFVISSATPTEGDSHGLKRH